MVIRFFAPTSSISFLGHSLLFFNVSSGSNEVSHSAIELCRKILRFAVRGICEHKLFFCLLVSTSVHIQKEESV